MHVLYETGNKIKSNAIFILKCNKCKENLVYKTSPMLMKLHKTNLLQCSVCVAKDGSLRLPV